MTTNLFFLLAGCYVNEHSKYVPPLMIYMHSVTTNSNIKLLIESSVTYDSSYYLSHVYILLFFKISHTILSCYPQQILLHFNKFTINCIQKRGELYKKISDKMNWRNEILYNVPVFVNCCLIPKRNHLCITLDHEEWVHYENCIRKYSWMMFGKPSITP